MKFLKKFDTKDNYLDYIADEPEYPHVALINEDRQVIYELDAPAPTPFYIEAIDDNITISVSDKLSDNTFWYSFDQVTWTKYNGSISKIPNGSTVYLIGEVKSYSYYGIGSFQSTGRFNVGGNVMSLLYGLDYEANSINSTAMIKRLFMNSKNLVHARMLQLPATTLVKECYVDMFRGCTSLVDAPKLPALTLAESCYQSMFKNCSSLVKAPALLAKTLVTGCYGYMFEGCSSLSYVRALFANEPWMQANVSWLSGVSPTGTFVKNVDATWENNVSYGVPKGWDVEYEKVPTQVIRFEKISSSDGAYITTDYYPSNYDRFEVKIAKPTSYTKMVFGARTGMECLFLPTQDDKGYVAWEASDTQFLPYSTSNTFIAKLGMVERGGVYESTWDAGAGETVLTTYTGEPDEVISQAPLYLLASNQPNSEEIDTRTFGDAIYYFKVFDSRTGKLKLDLFPATYGSKTGMYDAVSKKLYENTSENGTLTVA